VIRDNLVRCERLPLVIRVADLPPQAPDTAVHIAIAFIDLLAATFECRLVGLIGNETAD
jgi:exoribonuclease-2